MIPFVKMHGCGNDFVVVHTADLDALELGPEALADFVRRVCDRHFGLGADGVLAYAAAPPGALRMQYWNADGTRAEMCGNGARCVVRLAWERGETAPAVELATDTGRHPAAVLVDSAPLAVRLHLGPVLWEGAAIGLRGQAALIDAPLDVGDETLRVTALSLGNPHAVVFVPDRAALAAVVLETSGRLLAEHAMFRRGANASFVAVHSGDLHVRVWERGVGPTLACGTGAGAALAAAWRLRRLTVPRSRVHLPGGAVLVELDGRGDLWLTGPATRVAEGRLDAALLNEPPLGAEPS